MPRDSSGNYSLPAGNPVVTGTIIESAWANTTMPDLAVGVTDSLDRQGRGGMLAPLRTPDGTNLLPAHSFTSEVNSGWYRAGAGDIRLSVLGADRVVADGSGVRLDGRGIPANQNLLINGDMNVWQRGTSFASVVYEYTADRWAVASSTSVIRSVDVPADQGVGVSLRAERTSGDATFIYYGGLEFDRTGNESPLVLDVDYTLSLWVKTAASVQFDLVFYFADVSGSGTNRVTTATATVTGLTPGSWQRAEATVQFATPPNPTNTHMHIRFGFGADERVWITQVKLERGSVATVSEPELFPDVLPRCQRYFSKTFDPEVAPASDAGANGASQVSAVNDGGFTIEWRFPATMRVAPAVTTYNPNAANDNARNVNDATDTPVNVPNIGANSVTIIQSSKQPGDVLDRMRIHVTADAEF